MKPQDLTPTPTMNVTLMPDVQTLSEVVVTGMQKMDKRLFTGATKQLSADEVKLDGLPDISRGLKDAPQAYLYKMFPARLVLPRKSGYAVPHLFSVVQSHYG